MFSLEQPMLAVEKSKHHYCQLLSSSQVRRMFAYCGANHITSGSCVAPLFTYFPRFAPVNTLQLECSSVRLAFLLRLVFLGC